MRKILYSLAFISESILVSAQSSLFVQRPSDPVNVRSRVTLDFDSYYFVAENKFYCFRAGFFYGIPNDRHLFGIAVPFVHSIFSGNYAGYENTTGIGDLRFTYIGVPYLSKNSLGLERVSFALEVTAPTGNETLGRGVGTWLYRPGIVASIQPSPAFSLYPEVRFQFSGNEANSQGGGDGVPDPEDPEEDEKLQLLTIMLPVTYGVESWNGWVSLNTEYAYTFVEDTYFLFLRLDLGKMIGDKTSAALNITKFIAGQPRLETLIRVRFNFFLRPD